MISWSTATDTFSVSIDGSPVDGAIRFHNPLAEQGPPPFPAYVEPPVESPVDPPVIEPHAENPDDPVQALIGRPSPDSPPVPEFASRNGRALVRLQAAGVADRYGFGEVCGGLRHENRKIGGHTADTFAYDQRTLSMYQAHPWSLCVRPDGTAFGIIVETTYPYIAHLFDHMVIEIDGPPPPVTIVEGDTAAHVLRSLAQLTGTMPLPPRWALGYQQSKWNYAPAEQVLEVAKEFRDRKLPADVIWIDIDYMERYKVFTFDEPTFPDPTQLCSDLHDIGWRSAWMIDPGIKVEDGYHVYDEIIAGGHALTEPDGETPHVGVVWPGETVYPDFTRAETRQWWGELYEDFLATGLDAVWNDMNEPTTLESVPDKALPHDLTHRADDDLGGPDVHKRYRNVYGMLMTEASRDGITAARPDKRPFLLTRSTFLGGHRYAATWTGDNVSTWEHLHWSIPMALNLGLSGQPFAGPDIGGFAGHCTGPMLARWMGIGCLLPFARNHNMKTNPGQEPWLFGEQVEDTCRRALQRRYRLLPYLYTLFHEASTTGLPVMRPAFFADPADPTLRTEDTAFLLGDDLFVRCDVSADRRGPTAAVPVGWRRVHLLDEGDDGSDPELPELYLRPGAALPLGPVVQWSDELPLDEITLLANLDADGTAVGRLYEDAGDGFGYQSGDYRITEFAVTSRTAGDPLVEQAVVDGGWLAGDWTIDPIVITTTTRGPA